MTQICPVPLPLWMADSAGKGILIVAVCHGLAQLEARWDKAGAQAIWDTAGIKVILGGASDPDTLDRLSRLCGDIALRTHSRTRTEDGRRARTRQYQHVRVLPPELWRTWPEWRALVLRTNLSPVIVRLRMAWRRHDYHRTRPDRPGTTTGSADIRKGPPPAAVDRASHRERNDPQTTVPGRARSLMLASTRRIPQPAPPAGEDPPRRLAPASGIHPTIRETTDDRPAQSPRPITRRRRPRHQSRRAAPPHRNTRHQESTTSPAPSKNTQLC